MLSFGDWRRRNLVIVRRFTSMTYICLTPIAVATVRCGLRDCHLRTHARQHPSVDHLVSTRKLTASKQHGRAGDAELPIGYIAVCC